VPLSLLRLGELPPRYASVVNLRARRHHLFLGTVYDYCKDMIAYYCYQVTIMCITSITETVRWMYVKDNETMKLIIYCGFTQLNTSAN